MTVRHVNLSRCRQHSCAAAAQPAPCTAMPEELGSFPISTIGGLEEAAWNSHSSRPSPDSQDLKSRVCHTFQLLWSPGTSKHQKMLHFNPALWSAAVWSKGWILPETPEQDANQPYRYRYDRVHLPAPPPVEHSTCQVFHTVIKYLKLEGNHKNHQVQLLHTRFSSWRCARIMLFWNLAFVLNK